MTLASRESTCMHRLAVLSEHLSFLNNQKIQYFCLNSEFSGQPVQVCKSPSSLVGCLLIVPFLHKLAEMVKVKQTPQQTHCLEERER